MGQLTVEDQRWLLVNIIVIVVVIAAAVIVMMMIGIVVAAAVTRRGALTFLAYVAVIRCGFRFPGKEWHLGYLASRIYIVDQYVLGSSIFSG